MFKKLKRIAAWTVIVLLAGWLIYISLDFPWVLGTVLGVIVLAWALDEVFG